MTPLEFTGAIAIGIVLTVAWLRLEANRFLLGGSLTLRPGVVPTVKDESKARELQAVGEARAQYARQAVAPKVFVSEQTEAQRAVSDMMRASMQHGQATVRERGEDE